MATIQLNKKNEKIVRKDFSKVSGSAPLPNLVEIQTESYKQFLNEGIKEGFNDVYPIKSPNGNLELHFVDCEIGEPAYSIRECKNRDFTYSAPLKATLLLVNHTTGVAIQDKDVFMGDLPLMTESGTFIVNGAERIIVSQLVRSPGAYFKKTRDLKSGKFIYGGDIIPARGTWLEFESDSKDLLWVKVDKARKILGTVILRAIGLEDAEEIKKIFGEDEVILNTTLEKDIICTNREALLEIYNKLRPGEPATDEGAQNLMIQRFFDPKRYDLTKAGRYKFRKKLGVYNRLRGRILAEDLVDVNGEIIYTKETLMTKECIENLRKMEFFEKGAHNYTLNVNTNLDNNSTVQIVKVYNNDKKEKVCNIVGTDLSIEEKHVTIPDIIATFSYLMNIIQGFGDTDDIDHLANRRVRTIGELLANQFRIGLSRMERSVKEKMTIADAEKATAKSLTNIRPLTASIKEFFASSQLSQFMDQTNPLAELTNKRRLSALGPGGISRDRASFEVRDVHNSHYGRICPIETPEGPNIGLINYLATYAKVNEYGFLETPYRPYDKVNNRVLDEAVYLDADEEYEYIIAQANINMSENGEILDDVVIARQAGENIMAKRDEIDFVDLSPKQIVSVATACIPFLENDDGQRALMGANMQRQAIPLLQPHTPIVGTGLEKVAAKYSGLACLAEKAGTITYVDSTKIIAQNDDGTETTYELEKFARSNNGTCINQTAIVKLGQHVEKDDVIADGPSMEKGELALGQNVLIGFMTWNGYNYEDAVIMSERLVKDDVYTSLHIERYDIDCRDTKLGPEEFTRDVPNTSEEAKVQLDERGIVVPGAEVKEQDILVGKITPKGQTEPLPEEKLLMAIFGEKVKEGKDTSLRVPHGGAGIVIDVKVFSRAKGDELPAGVKETVRVYVAQKRKISEGDKMAGRHGNKGVISRILPVEDMPFLPDGTPLDIMLNPLGVPSRMNIGQVLEVHLGYAAAKLGLHIATPVFDGITNEELMQLLKDANMASDGKTVLYDGRTGEPFDERINVGCMYMIKLAHMVDDKLHARAIGPYSLITQQPLGGKALNGGQRFGEMEVWALEAYGAAHILQEILTIKSDDMIGRSKCYEAIIKGKPIPQPGIPEAFRVLTKELQALAIDIRLLDDDGTPIDMKEVAKENTLEESRISESIKEVTMNTALDEEGLD